MSNDQMPAADRGSECNDLLGLLPEQAGWAVEMHGQCVLFANNAEKSRGSSPGAKTRVFTESQVLALLAAERERCAAAVRATPPYTWVDGSDYSGRPCPAKVVTTREQYAQACLGPNALPTWPSKEAA